MPEKALAVIPARYGAQRLPGKPLALIAGKPMIQHVYERVRAASSVGPVIVATDDRRILECVESFGGQAMMTEATHRSGTDRVAEVAAQYDSEVIANIQGDEPLIEPQMIDDCIAALLLDERARIATLACEVLDIREYDDPNVVKVVTNRWGTALYFSRAPIPYFRDQPKEKDREAMSMILKHVGVYVFRREFLFKFATSRQGVLERIESLEQLRALEYGHKIKVVRTRRPTIAVDTPEDLRKAEIIMTGSAGGHGQAD
jgi:3-deoxy-manno-octulosonate cytidylyltransferase (CMP-KDO synthetase)